MNNCITDFLGLGNVLIKNVVETSSKLSVFVETKPSYPNCPSCGNRTSRIHDYRNQIIKDLPYRNLTVNLFLRKRRYRCSCGKRFFEKYSFLPRYHHMSQRVYLNILKELTESVTFKCVAKRFGVSTNTVARVCDMLNYTLYKLPETISIDEFKGNSGGNKYQCILTNPTNHKLLDILATREKDYLHNYFSNYERGNVKYFIMDMWEPYKDIALTLFPKAMIIIDKYHYIRQVYWALDKVRKRVEKTLSEQERVYLKKQRYLLRKKYYKLKPYEKNNLKKLLSIDNDLKTAWELKELFLDFTRENNPDKAAKLLKGFIEISKEVNIEEFRPVITAYTNWFEYIINSKRVALTNAYTEGTNNKIKVLKRIGYLYTNFERFRNRILHLK